MSEELNNGQVLKIFLILRGLQEAYEEMNDSVRAGEIFSAVELLTHLSAENEMLKKQISELEERLRVVSWGFGQ